MAPINVDHLMRFCHLRHYLTNVIRSRHDFQHSFIPLMKRIDFGRNAHIAQHQQHQECMNEVNSLLHHAILSRETQRVWFALSNLDTGERTPANFNMPKMTNHPTSAVALLFYWSNEQVHTIVLRKAALNRAKDSGYMYSLQASLPGGILQGEESFEQCALRETKEETGVDASIINDTLPCVHTLTVPKSTCVQPFIGVAEDMSGMRIQEDEVAQLFELPLVDMIDGFDESGVYMSRRLSDNVAVEYHGFLYNLSDRIATFTSKYDISEDLAARGERLSDLRVWGMTARLLTYVLCRLEHELLLSDGQN